MMNDAYAILQNAGAHPLEVQMGAAYQLARAADPVILPLLDEPGNLPDEVEHAVVDGLIDGAPATLGAVLDRLARSPQDTGGQNCAYILGEIAFRGGEGVDPRILPALVEALRGTIPAGSPRFMMVIAAIREVTRRHPISEDALAEIEAALHQTTLENEPYGWCIQNALEILIASRGQGVLDLLQARYNHLAPDHPLLTRLRDLSAQGHSE